MTGQTATPGQLPRRSRFFSDRSTAVRLGLIAAAFVILMILIGAITVFAAQAITDTVQQQYAEQQKLLAGSLARQLESFFNTLANDLVGLSARPPVQSMVGSDAALRLLNDVGTLRKGQIKAIVRIARDGTPRYAWPESYNALVEKNSPLPWSVDAAWVDGIIQSNGVQLVRRSTGNAVAYLLVAPLSAGLNLNEVLAFEINIQDYFTANFSALDLGQTGQLWVFDRFGTQMFSFRPQPEFSGGTAQFLGLTDTTLLPGYPTPDRESIVAPIYTAFTQDRSGVSSLMLILSRTISEANLVVQDTLQTLLRFSFGLVALMVSLGVLIGFYILRESNRRRREEHRRSIATTLLNISRTLNSSLELNLVLRRILENLGTILPHDNASILLLNEAGTAVTVAAEMGASTLDNQRTEVPLEEVQGAKEVLSRGKPVIINDTLHDSHWTQVPGSPIRSWLGVPLRVRDEAVGVLNINSHAPNRFSADDSDFAQAFADQAGVAIQNARAHELQIQVYEAELETARAIQNSLLPQDLPPLPQIQLTVRSVAARHVSGDFYQYYMLPDGRLGLAVGDVSGKGIPAALLMAVISTTLRDEILRQPSPASLLSELNERLLPRMQQNKMNSALILSIFDPHTRHLEIASGGMLSPYVRNGAAWREIELSGYPLGAAAASHYSAKTVTLAPGSMVIFLTDGVIESQNATHELFGYDRFEALLAGLPPTADIDTVADAILDAVRQHLGGQEPQDDITILILKSL